MEMAVPWPSCVEAPVAVFTACQVRSLVGIGPHAPLTVPANGIAWVVYQYVPLAGEVICAWSVGHGVAVGWGRREEWEWE